MLGVARPTWMLAYRNPCQTASTDCQQNQDTPRQISVPTHTADRSVFQLLLHHGLSVSNWVLPWEFTLLSLVYSNPCKFFNAIYPLNISVISFCSHTLLLNCFDSLYPSIYNCGRFFLYYQFSFCISYISVYWGWEPLGLVYGLVRCTHWVQVFRCARGGCDNHRCHNKNPT